MGTRTGTLTSNIKLANKHTEAKPPAPSLSLSLSLSHTHTHTHSKALSRQFKPGVARLVSRGGKALSSQSSLLQC